MVLPLRNRNVQQEEFSDRGELSLYVIRDLVNEFLVNRMEKYCGGSDGIALDVALEYIDRIRAFNIYHESVASLLTHKREVFKSIPPVFGTELIRELYLFVAAHIVTGFGEHALHRFCNDLRISAHLAHVSFDEHEFNASTRESERKAYDMVLQNGAAEWVPMVILLKLTHVEIEDEGNFNGA